MSKFSKSHRLEFLKPKVIRKPDGASPADLIVALGQAAVTGSLPAGWEVEQGWKNGEGEEKYVPVEKMVRDSAGRGNFTGMYLNRYLGFYARRYGVSLPQIRTATEQEAELFHRRDEYAQQRESVESATLARKMKRSKAAAKGAETRRLKRAEAERKKAEALAKRARAKEARARAREAERRAAEALARKRAEAARKGWETRRRKALEAAKKTKGRKR